MFLALVKINTSFDTVNHSILLNRLKYRFGLGGKILQWIEDYLTGHTQRVIIDNNGEGEPRVESSENNPVPRSTPRISPGSGSLLTIYCTTGGHL